MKGLDKLLYNLPEKEQLSALTISRHFHTLGIIFLKTISFSLVLQQKSKPVQMMSRIGTFRVAEIPSEKFRILEVPYASGPLSLWVLLPDDISGLEQVWVSENHKHSEILSAKKLFTIKLSQTHP